MYSTLKLFTLTLYIYFVATTAVYAQQYKNCSTHAYEAELSTDCPVNSQCVKVNELFQCVCLQNFEFNTKWLQQENSNLTSYCLLVSTALPTSTTTAPLPEIQNKSKVYVQGPAKTEHLAFGILIVLLIAVLATGALYTIKVLRPLKRTRIAYMKLKRKRQNRRPLRDNEEINMSRRDSDIEVI